MSKNRVVVRINGSEYVLTGDEKEDYLFSIANYVDKKVKEILGQNAKHSTTSAAVLAALTIADELYKVRNENSVLRDKGKEPIEKYENLIKKYEEINIENQRLTKENQKVNGLCKENIEQMENIKSEYENVKLSTDKKDESLEELIKENAFLKENNLNLEKQMQNYKLETNNLKDQLFENQLEIIRTKKDFKELRDLKNKKNV